MENGPRELELLFRAVVFHPSVPILITDNERNYRDASTGAGRLLGLPRDKIIGRRLDDFADPAFRPRITEIWQAFLGRGEQEGTLRLGRPGWGPLGRGVSPPKGTSCPCATFWSFGTRPRPGKRGSLPNPAWMQSRRG